MTAAPGTPGPAVERPTDATTPPKTTLDWRDLAPVPDVHSCDCNRCDLDGDLEDPAWPYLVIAEDTTGDYVTDRVMMVRADRAPIPPRYEGIVSPDRPRAASLLACLSAVTDDQPTGMHFRWTVLKALELTGWDLRRLDDGIAADAKTTRRVAVVDQAGDTIGIAIAHPDLRDNFWDDDQPRLYDDWAASRG